MGKTGRIQRAVLDALRTQGPADTLALTARAYSVEPGAALSAAQRSAVRRAIGRLVDDGLVVLWSRKAHNLSVWADTGRVRAESAELGHLTVQFNG